LRGKFQAQLPNDTHSTQNLLVLTQRNTPQIMINYDQRIFRVTTNSENGETDEETLFHYRQEGRILSCIYSGRQIVHGQLLGMVSEDGSIDMRYHQINAQGVLMTGECRSTPEILADGRIRLHEKWQWTSGDRSEGRSILEEILPH
jgi:hypothetical protein